MQVPPVYWYFLTTIHFIPNCPFLGQNCKITHFQIWPIRNRKISTTLDYLGVEFWIIWDGDGSICFALHILDKNVVWRNTGILKINQCLVNLFRGLPFFIVLEIHFIFTYTLLLVYFYFSLFIVYFYLFKPCLITCYFSHNI